MLDYHTSKSRPDPTPIQRQSSQPDFSLRKPRRRDVGGRETTTAGPGSEQSLRGGLDHASPYPRFRPPLLGARSEGPVPAAPADTRSGDGAGEIPPRAPTTDHTFIHR